MSEFHQLHQKWTLWAHLPKNPDWSHAGYKKVMELSTLEQTIAIIESLPEWFVQNCMLFVMKDGVLPTWEDPQNRHGGYFSYRVPNKQVLSVWRDLTYVLVGRTISAQSSFMDCVTGITVSPKKHFCIIKIWVSNCDFQNPQIVTKEIGNLIAQGCLFKPHTPEF